MTPPRTPLVIVLTGDGKGKTTSAFGQALRAAGGGLRVAIVQFIKGSWQTGEIRALERTELPILIERTGRGFTVEKLRDPRIPMSDHAEAARHGLARAYSTSARVTAISWSSTRSSAPFRPASSRNPTSTAFSMPVTRPSTSSSPDGQRPPASSSGPTSSARCGSSTPLRAGRSCPARIEF